MLGDRIAYVAAVTRDVALAAELLEEALELPRTDLAIAGRGAAIPVFAIGNSALALLAQGDPFVDAVERTGIHHIAIACRDPRAAAMQADAAGLDLGSTEPGPGLGGGEVFELSAASTAGIRTRLCAPLTLPRPTAGLVERFDHIGIATDDCAAGVACFHERLGFPIESRQTDAEIQIAVESFTSDRYGVVYHSRPPQPVGGGQVVFVTIGDTELELLQPLGLEAAGRPAPGVEHGRPGDTRQDMGALARFVTSRGAGLHHVALKVRSTDRALEQIRRAGGRTIDETGRPGSRRARIGFVHPASLGGVLIHFDERSDPLRD